MRRETKGLRTWIEIERAKIAHNYKVMRHAIPKRCKMMAVVKSNAYGHSLVDFSREISACGADWLGVDSIVEAIRLRKNGIKKPILVLGFTLPEMLEQVLAFDVSITVSSMDMLTALTRRKLSRGRVMVHIKIDSGMHRQGFFEKDVPKIIAFAQKNKGKILIEGLYTHFAAGKNPAFPQSTHKQIEIFKRCVASFKKTGFNPIVHASATAGALLFYEATFDMVRVGIALYGLWPAKETRAYLESKITLKPVLSWKTIIGEIKKLPKGAKVGYDHTETLERDSIIAICPVGYWHGYPRSLSCLGSVLVRGRVSKIVGRISMDMIVVDVTDCKGAKAGDEVTLIGYEGKHEISVEGLAEIIDASPYEFITRINPLIKRIYI